MLASVDSLLRRTLHSLPDGPRLNLGCGWDVRNEFVNTDVALLKGLDVVARVGPGRLPFADGTFSLVLCRDVLEHVDTVDALKEVHRVLKPGGAAVISAVHFSSRNLYVDPTHIRGFSARTFEYFVEGSRGGDRSYYFDYSFQTAETTIQFSALLGRGRYMIWDRFLEPIVNRSRSTQDLYEMTFLARAFPSANVLCVLQK